MSEETIINLRELNAILVMLREEWLEWNNGYDWNGIWAWDMHQADILSEKIEVSIMKRDNRKNRNY